MIRLMLLTLAAGTAGCIDFREGLACTSDGDCLGYLCVEAVCTGGREEAPEGDLDGDDPSGDGTETVASGQKDATSLRQDATTLYWLAMDGGRLKLRKALKTGKSNTEVADIGPFSSSAKTPAMVIAGDDIYIAAGKGIFRIGKNGGTPTVVASTGGPDYGGGIGVAGSTLVWLSPGTDASVWKMPLAGGTPVEIASAEGYVESLVAGGGVAYWPGQDGVVVYDLAESTKATFSGGPGAYPKGIAMSGSVVTWLSGEGSFLTVTVTQVGSESSSSFAVDEDLIAAASDGSTSVFAVSRAKESQASTGLFEVKTGEGTYSYQRATGGSGVTGGVASEVIADASTVYLVVHDMILRRAR